MNCKNPNPNINQAIENAKATLAFEGLHVTKEEAMIRKRLNGEMTENEYNQYIFDFVAKENLKR